jgi:hypothetical protein
MAAGWICAAALPAIAEDLYHEADALRAKYAAEVGKLASWCDEHGMAAEAQQTRHALGPQDPFKIYLPILPGAVGPPEPPENAAPAALQWHAQFLKLRQEQAAALYALARRAIGKHQSSLAYQLVLDAIRQNPDHEAARRVFGYQKYQDQWHTAYEVRKLRAGMVWNESFGWLSKGNVARYEAGERLCNGRWLSQEADARAHANIRSGWEIESEHYLIRTDRSIEAGVALGAKLENLNRLWQQIFVGFYASDKYVDALFTGRGQARAADVPRFNVVYFRNHEEYVRALEPKMPDIGISLGFYRSVDRTAYFCAGGADTERVMHHEATHQLFQQSRPAAGDVGERANFWIVEGIAMFMESLHRENGDWVLGGPNDPRIVAARYHLLQEDFYMPFAQITALGVRDLQTHPKIAKLYSQIAAMTHLLIFADGGRHRDALVAYLSAVYNGNQDPGLLSRLLGVDYADLDRQYREFLEAGLPAKPPSE